VGGCGSGRSRTRPYGTTVEEAWTIDLRGVGRAGLRSGIHVMRSLRFDELGNELPVEIDTRGPPVLRLYYGACEVDEFPLETTTPNYSGARCWVRCHCGRRCRTLHVPKRYNRSGPTGFRCRQCSGLRYTSQCETREDRWMRRARKIERRLERDWNRMRPATCERLQNEAEEWEACAISVGFVRAFGKHPMAQETRAPAARYGMRI
jgi:hypothetical protein